MNQRWSTRRAHINARRGELAIQLPKNARSDARLEDALSCR